MVEKVGGHDGAHVKLGTDAKEVPAGPTVVSVLKQELGVDSADTLFLKEGNKRLMLADGESIDVKTGMHFEALHGGSVS